MSSPPPQPGPLCAAGCRPRPDSETCACGFGYVNSEGVWVGGDQVRAGLAAPRPEDAERLELYRKQQSASQSKAVTSENQNPKTSSHPQQYSFSLDDGRSSEMTGSSGRRKRHRQIAHDCVVLAALIIGLLWLISPQPPIRNNSGAFSWSPLAHDGRVELGQLNPLLQAEDFQWLKLVPATVLVYSTCFRDFKCARLRVPFDWNDLTGDTDTHVDIAVIRLPARVHVTDPRYGGAIIINPGKGGPGVSGVGEILWAGKRFQRIVDSPLDPLSAPESSKYFDIISFDPRGINNTTPRLQCYPTAAAEMRWEYQLSTQETIDHSDTAFGIAWARARAMGQSCLHSNSSLDSARLSNFTNTTPTAADMVEIIEQHGNWRSQTARAWLDKACEKTKDTVDRHSIISRTQWTPGQEKLQYWGFSYGTALGSTFATMYPEKVRRMILDGVIDIDDYFRGEWLKNLQDTDAIMNRFFEYCYQSGPNACAFYDKSPAQIEQNLELLLQSLQHQPMPVPGTETIGPDIITSSDVMRLIKTTLYSPLEMFPFLANLLANLMKGNGSEFAVYKAEYTLPRCPYKNGDQGSYECDPDGFSWEGFTSISCTDGNDISNMSAETFKEYTQILRNQSRWMGGTWAELRLKCVGWDATAAWKLEGPIVAATHHPLLLLGNTLDPVSPIANAHNATHRFKDSVVLQQDTEGHCSYAAPSACTDSVIRDYFSTGTLPPVGKICTPDAKPFSGISNYAGHQEIALRTLKNKPI
ncbi:hypothetical protein B7463_g872, partial [Scytalidium lignicola]